MKNRMGLWGNGTTLASNSFFWRLIMSRKTTLSARPHENLSHVHRIHGQLAFSKIPVPPCTSPLSRNTVNGIILNSNPSRPAILSDVNVSK